MNNNGFIPYNYNELCGDLNANFSISFYHISKDKLNLNKPLKPRVYGNPSYTKTNIEENHIPRICLSSSIQGCLKGIYNKVNIGDELYVYKIYINRSKKKMKNIGYKKSIYMNEMLNNPYTLNMLVKPTLRSVYDSSITDEYWYLGELNPRDNLIINIGTITITDICYSYECIDYVEIDKACMDNYYYDNNQLYIYPEFFYNFIPNNEIVKWDDKIYNAKICNLKFCKCTNINMEPIIRIKIQSNWNNFNRKVMDIDTNKIYSLRDINIPYDLNQECFKNNNEYNKFISNLFKYNIEE